VPTYGFLFREKYPPLNVKKEMIGEHNLTLKEIATLKSGEDVLREDSGVILAAKDFTYTPFEPRSFAYCCDTAPFRELADVVKGVDLLYHEATFAYDLKDMAKSTFHSTATDAANVAKEAGVEQLVLGHFSSRYSTLDHLKDEASSVFPNTKLASKGERFDVELVKYR
jgi:ribonuclease Z